MEKESEWWGMRKKVTERKPGSKRERERNSSERQSTECQRERGSERQAVRFMSVVIKAGVSEDINMNIFVGHYESPCTSQSYL